MQIKIIVTFFVTLGAILTSACVEPRSYNGMITLKNGPISVYSMNGEKLPIPAGPASITLSDGELILKSGENRFQFQVPAGFVLGKDGDHDFSGVDEKQEIDFHLQSGKKQSVVTILKDVNCIAGYEEIYIAPNGDGANSGSVEVHKIPGTMQAFVDIEITEPEYRILFVKADTTQVLGHFTYHGAPEREDSVREALSDCEPL